MGIQLRDFNDRQRELMAPEDRKALGIEAPSQTKARMLRRLERDEQNLLASWLSLREADGVLVYDWSRMDRKTTNRKGIPDFRIYARDKVLLGEMKLEWPGRLSVDQAEMIDKFVRSGTHVQIWHSAATAIERIRDWLMAGTNYGKI